MFRINSSKFFIMMALIAFSSINVFAETEYIFGPNEYVHTTIKTADLYVETFSATPGEARLVVENGGEGGRVGVESARILLNGKQIIGSGNFSAGCMYPSCKMVEPVTLAAENTLSIELIDGRKNSRLSVCIVWPPSIHIDANPKTIEANSETILTWSSVNADSCFITPGYSIVSPNGSMSVRPLKSTTYKIEGSGFGETVTDSVTVVVFDPPTVTFSADPQIINPGGVSTLTWSSTGATSCSIDPEIGTVNLNDSIEVSPAETTTYTITATGQLSNVVEHATVTVTDSPIPSVSLSANPRTIHQGGSSTLTWTSSNADSINIEPGIYSGADPNGSIEVKPAGTTTYKITATGSGMSCTDEITVKVGPAVTISADPLSVRPNGTSTLSWTTQGADICVIDPDIGSFNPQGSIQITLSETTTYTIMAFGPGGCSTATVTVAAEGAPLPTVKISANNESVCDGTYSRLTWSSTYADSCSIEPGIGVVGTNGFILVSPAETTTYSITASSSEGSASKSLTVYACASPPPVAYLRAHPYAIYQGERTQLTWGSTNTSYDGCRLYPGNYVSSGSNWSNYFKPDETTTYTVVATGPGGVSTASITVVVIEHPILTINASTTNIFPNQSVILTWNSSDTDTCMIEPGMGLVGSSGSVEVWPTESTTYTITIDGPIGPYSKSVRVNIKSPTVTIEADPQSIFSGGKSILSWSATHADTCEITPGIGVVDFSGSIEVSPAESTKYKILARNTGGASVAYADVHVIKPPTGDIWVSGSSIIQPGGSTSLTWSTTNADLRVIEPGIGPVAPTGTIHQVSPAETTQYTLTATGPLGTATDSCVVGVVHSSEVVVFGPAQYNRTGGKANLYTETFSASPGKARLIVKNGDESGGFRLTEATILLNGVEIFSPSDFGPSIYQLEKEVTHASENTLSISLKRGVKNSYLTIQVFQDPLPAVSISADPQTVIKGNETTLSWTSENAYICRITPSIYNVMPNGSISIAPDKTTTYTIAATGTGGTATGTTTITVVDPPPTVDIAADPALIKSGETSLLTWTSQNASSCTIEPGIGPVSPSGSIQVSPAETTTYTITANGTGGSASNTATVSVCPLPVVIISADPAYIQPGQMSTLVWSSMDADSCTITPDIGSVAPSGAMTVSPAASTTYTITAEGLGGTATASAAIEVIDPPAVSISANPQTVYTGEASTLSWTSANADSCVIYEYGSDPQNPLNTYPVNAAGTLDVLPAQTSTYTIIASNPVGEASDSVMVSYIYSPIQLNITSPGTGEYISRPYTLVKGTVIDSSPADEIGVTVNGVIALVFQNEFAANHVPLENGENIITVTATDSEGNVRSKSVTVSANTDVDHIWVTSGNESAGLPFTTELEMDGSFNFLSPNFYDTGPGTVEYLETGDNTFLVRIDWGGIYYFHFEAVDSQNNEYDDTLAVLVHSNSAIDALLQRRWTSLLDDLNTGDMNSALDLVHTEKRHLFEMVFGNMIPKMPDFMPTYLGITLISVYGNEAEYKISTIENGVRYKYPLYFHKDTNGLWKVLSF